MSDETTDLDWTSGPNVEVGMLRAHAVRDAVAAELREPAIMEASRWGFGDDECFRADVRHGGVVVWSLSWAPHHRSPRGRESWGVIDGPVGVFSCDAGSLSIPEGVMFVVANVATSAPPVVGDVYHPRPGRGCAGRIVVDHVIGSRVYGHGVWAADMFESDAVQFASNYERDAAWCDGTMGTMGTIEHPGMNGAGI